MSDILTAKELEDIVTKAINNFGAPNQMFLDPNSTQAYINMMLSSLNPIRVRVKSVVSDKLHRRVINFKTADILEDTVNTLDKMGFLKHVPKE